jgi:hypothetical protein
MALLNFLLKPLVSAALAKFVYPEIVHPTLLKLWRSRDWERVKKMARDTVVFYNHDSRVPGDLKQRAALELVRSKARVAKIDISDSKINLAIELAVTAEKVRWK